MAIIKIGILDIQGSVEEHFAAVSKIKKDARDRKVEAVLVKNSEDLKSVSALIMPGGESTTIGKLLRRFGLREEIISRVKKGMPIMGTCAGAILLSKKIVGKEQADSLNLMDISISRNAYGRQLDSFETEISWDSLDEKMKTKKIPAVFIRAPKILEISKDAKILAKYKNEIVAVRQKNMLALTFHPEMTTDKTVYEEFAGMIN